MFIGFREILSRFLFFFEFIFICKMGVIILSRVLFILDKIKFWREAFGLWG